MTTDKIDLSEYLTNTTGRITGKIAETISCDIGLEPIFYWFMLPLIFIIILLIILRFKEEIKLRFMFFFSKRGYIKIYYILTNKKIKERLKKLDKFNNFQIGKRKYNLDKMHDFIIGYDKYNFPIFMYDVNFILPFKMEKKTIDETITQQYNLEELKIEDKNEIISQIIMKIDSSILKTVYDKKLISDLYSISSGDIDLRKKIYIGIGIFILLIFMYYTGLLDQILSYVGLEPVKK